MGRTSLHFLFVFSIFAIVYSSTYGAEHSKNGRGYDLDDLFSKTADRYKNSLRLQEASDLNYLKFGGIDDELEFEPSGGSWLNDSKCNNDLSYAFKNVLGMLKMFDSYGKPASGILLGNSKWIGNYEECLDFRSSNPMSNTTGNFVGKYCSVSWSLDLAILLQRKIDFVTGVCVPDSCGDEEVKDEAVQLLKKAGVIPKLKILASAVNITSATCKPRERHLNGPAKAMIAVLVILVALTVAGSSITAVKYFKEIIQGFNNSRLLVNASDGRQLITDQADELPEKGEGPSAQVSLRDDVQDGATSGLLCRVQKIFGCFCVFTNGSKILNTDVPEGELLCIHGIRFLSMSWVILGHTYLFGIQEISNILGLLTKVDTFLFQIVLQGFYSVDSFFVLSGFLLAYLSMKEFAKSKGKIAWGYFYIHRYIRLTPMYMLLLGFFASVYLYLGSGPFWPDGDVDTKCRDTWWRNLIYINNFDNQSEQCMGWSWYLANDMQFFIISPLFLISLWRWPKIGYSLISIFLVACWLSNFFITYHFDLLPGLSNVSKLSLNAMQDIIKFFDKLYIKPYTRISPYLIGLLTGYFLFKRKAIGSPKHSLIFLTGGWIISSAITLTCLFGMYHTDVTLLGDSFYNALNRTGFALGLSWVIYVCLIEQGGFINRMLSFKLFIPLSRLTYAAYLIHPMIINGYYASLKTTLEFNHPTMVYLFLGFMVMTYLLALPVALVLESPIVSLEKLVRKAFVKPNKTEAVN